MPRTKILLAAVTTIALATSAQAAMQSPDQVKKALGTLNRVVDHTQRLITAKNYTRLPHENGEFQEGAEALETGITGEPAAFKAKVEPLLKQAEAASKSVADAADAKDDAKLASTHAAFAASVSKVLMVFPAEVRPQPAAASP
jgi:hypothetical protein